VFSAGSRRSCRAAQSKFDRELEAVLDSLAVGVGRFLAGLGTDGTRRTDATFFRSRVLPKTEGRVPRSAYRPGWQRLAVRLTTLSAVSGTGYAYWEQHAATLQALEYGGTGAAASPPSAPSPTPSWDASAASWCASGSVRCTSRSPDRCGFPSRPTRAATSTSRPTSPMTTP
jgi:hypothetical protein